MTLIIASATHQEQILVADRLITDANSGNVYDERHYKIVVFRNRRQNYEFAAAFTGLAALDNESTVDWLMDILPKVMTPSVNAGDGITAFNRACTVRYSKIGQIPFKWRGTTFIFCGWYYGQLENKSINAKIPFVSITSNAIDKIGRQINSVSREFSSFSTRLFKNKSGIRLCRGDLISAGRHTSELRNLFRILRRDVSHKAKVQFATQYIRQVSLSSKSVGSDILGVAFTESGCECFDYHIDDNNCYVTMPHFVSADGARMTNFRGGPVKPS